MDGVEEGEGVVELGEGVALGVGGGLRVDLGQCGIDGLVEEAVAEKTLLGCGLRRAGGLEGVGRRPVLVCCAGVEGASLACG